MENNDSQNNQKKYKVKDLKIYCSTEALLDNKKQYRSVFDKAELTYIYAEVSFFNKNFDLENWDANIQMKCYELNPEGNREVCNLNLVKKISKYDAISFVREGWGSKKEGSFWKAGSYYWEVFIEGEFIGNRYFYIEDSGSKKQVQVNKYLAIKGAKLFEGTYDDGESILRNSFTTFSSEQTRYVFLELTLENQFTNQLWNCEMFVRYYNDGGEHKNTAVKLRPVNIQEKDFTLIFGFGSNTKGTWHIGKYRMEVVFMGKIIAVLQFRVDADFIEGIPQFINHGIEQPSILKIDEDDNRSFAELVKGLDTLIGLEEIKKRVKDHAQYINFIKLRKDYGFKEAESSSLYIAFTGNPGTGKTTVAKMLGKLYKKMGLLTKGHVHEVDRADLVGEYIGQTAPKVKDAIEKARGGILFIDEAYALARSNDDNKDFGREVIEILIKEMSSGRQDLGIIVAGYPKEMKTFIDSNPGLSSRFKYYFEFADYTPDELMNIADYACHEKELVLAESGKAALEEIIIKEFRKRTRTFGNARFVNEVIDKAKINLGLRIVTQNKKKYAKKELMTLVDQDFVKIDYHGEKKVYNFPIDQKYLAECLDELDGLLGMDNIKNQIRETVDIIKFYKESGQNVLCSMSLHTLLIGNPGTGKTTIARLLTKIYKALGLLERGHIVETDRQGLVAGFVGQTAIKTAERIDEAMNGVLFIDEAYALSNFGGLQGDFGNEAIQTILKRMEDDRGKFYIFAAGYPDNMENFIKMNPGLSSRFDKILRFEDYSVDELNQIALSLFKKSGYTLDEEVTNIVKDTCYDMYLKRDKYFGNARAIRKYVNEVIKNQNLRVAKAINNKEDVHLFNQIIAQDCLLSSDHNSVEIKKVGIGFKK
jgi:SpoVK/Ycf46/Vps4 family AAA+-type ATPase